MLRKLAAAGLITLFFGACSTQSTLTEYSQSPEKPAVTMADVLPGLRPATAAVKKEQAGFVAVSQKKFISLKVAAAYYVAGARRTFNEQKTDSAAYLFGRAWLLDSTNNEVYWGYGLVYGQQKQFDKALFILYKALENDKENARLLTDIATSHLGRFYEESNPEDLLQSRKLLQQAVAISPENSDAYYKLAVSSYYLQEYRKAWEYLHHSLRTQKEISDKTFISALLGKHHDPQGIYNLQNIQ